MINLQTLYLQYNQIANFDATLNNLTQVSTINLTANDQLACYQLDALETALGQGVVVKPVSCVASLLISDIQFSDANLAACVQATASSKAWTLISEVSELSCGNRNISDLNGLQHFNALTLLTFENNQVFSLAPLAGISELELLYFYHNDVSDLSPLANLTALLYLNLR